MAYTDTLTAEILVKLIPRITSTDGLVEGSKQATHKITKSLTDGSGTNKATGFFSETFTSTTGGITVSLADSVDPLGSAGDDIPTSDPEGLKLRAILIENLDATNFVTVKRGTNGEASILSGATDGIVITAGGLFLWTSPAGISAMNDGVDDELLFTADTSNVSVKLTYVFG